MLKGTMSMSLDRPLENTGRGGGPVNNHLQLNNSPNHHLQVHGNRGGAATMQLSVSERRITSTGGVGGSGKHKIQPGSVSSFELLSKMAVDYSLYCQTDLSAQISRLEEYLQESIAKLEEQQSLFEIKEIESREWTTVILPQLVKQATLMSDTFTKRLDSLNELIVSIKTVLDQLEKQISLAEQRMGLQSSSTAASSFRSVFKYFMKADTSSQTQSSTAEGVEALKAWESAKAQLVCEDPLNLTSFFKT